MTPSEAEKEFEEVWSKHHDDELCNSNPILKLVSHWYYFEAYSREQEKIEKLKAGLSDLINTIEFLNPFGSGHPNIKLRVQLDTLKKLLDET